MATVYSFPPLVSAEAKLLILGSMPGTASLTAGQYYAHPRNLFWPIMGELLGAAPTLSYQERTRILTSKGIAVWDVLKSCSRTGSLDAAINKSSMVNNDFSDFLSGYPQIKAIFFNGSTAEKTFSNFVLAHLNNKALHLQRLPSTSPAHAALSYSQKLESWRVILEYI
ncbi:DNA-deoxyinosine glycosylase [Methylomonas sp. AM2-LC]|uniref:DNA-deoxyinosine glycosylase n=1 Tax=Methylomonas sp. AM2-LC TaxID=3153301 RepID=UPI00326323E8